ncbi:hypothetical protein ACFLXQ_08185 [Chloroflexota bacterium]
MIENIGMIATVVLGFLGMILGYSFQRLQLKLKQREDERKEIYKKLNDFYGPVQQYLRKSEVLYKRFASTRPDGFRTLVALLEGEKFEGNDAVLLEQIIEIIVEVEKLILTQGGLIDDREIRDLFAKAGTHFRILQLAYHGKLKGDVERFEGYVYPRELNQVIEDEIQKRKARLDELNTVEDGLGRVFQWLRESLEEL